MTYKARRTRDLQGEVKAGTGISVTESAKPDGTKEYTITNGDPASAITVSGEGLSLIANVLKNTMAEELGFHAQTGNQSTSINWYDDNSDPVLIIQELERLFIGDVKDNAGFFLKQESPTDNKLISGDVQIAESVIATGGVSLQTLADKANNIMQQIIPTGGTKSFSLDTSQTGYIVADGTIAVFDYDYIGNDTIGYNNTWQWVNTYHVAEDDTCAGISFLKKGLYRLKLDLQGVFDLENNNVRIELLFAYNNTISTNKKGYAVNNNFNATGNDPDWIIHTDFLFQVDVGDVITPIVIARYWDTDIAIEMLYDQSVIVEYIGQ